MDRRRFLGLVAGGVAATLAGCAGDGDGTTAAGTTTDDGGTPTGTTPTPTTTAGPTPTPTTTAGGGEAASAIETAAERLGTAGRAIARESDSTDGISGPDVDAETVRDHLDAAEAALDRAAGSDPTADQRETIDALREFADALAATTDTLVAMNDGFRRFEAAQRALESERYDAAVDEIVASREVFSTARERVRTAREDLSGIDATELPAAAGDPDETRAALETFETLLGTMDRFLSGYAEFVRGQSNLRAGFTAVEAEDYDRAATRFGSARDRYDRGRSAMVSAADRARAAELSDLVADLDRLVCLLGALRDGSDHLVDAAEAYEEGETAAGDDAREAARQAFDRCEDGDGTTSESDAALRARRALRDLPEA